MTTPKLILSACLTACLILCFINWPGITLAAFLVVASIAALVGGIWLQQAKSAGDEHDAEHDLP